MLLSTRNVIIKKLLNKNWIKSHHIYRQVYCFLFLTCSSLHCPWLPFKKKATNFRHFWCTKMIAFEFVERHKFKPMIPCERINFHINGRINRTKINKWIFNYRKLVTLCALVSFAFGCVVHCYSNSERFRSLSNIKCIRFSKLLETILIISSDKFLCLFE